MRSAIVLLPVFLCACSTAPADPPIHGVTPGHKCDAQGLSRFIGESGTSETGSAIKHSSHAAVLRWAPPGVMLTMDYREDRVTVHLDGHHKITQISCG